MLSWFGFAVFRSSGKNHQTKPALHVLNSLLSRVRIGDISLSRHLSEAQHEKVDYDSACAIVPARTLGQ